MKQNKYNNAEYIALRLKSGMRKKAFADYFGISYNTAQKWEQGKSQCAPYLLDLMEYKLQHEGLI